MKLIGHRGMGAKENTTAAFKNAIASNRVVGFELDIRLSGDNDIVVIHDSFIDRVFDDTGLVNKLSTKYLKSIGVPKLEDVLNLNTNKIIIVEVKDTNIDYKELLEILHKSKKNIYLMSFHNDYIHEILKYNPKFKVGILHNVFNREYNYDEYDFIGLYAGFATDNIIKYFKEKNIELFLFGIDENNQMFSKWQKLSDVYLIVDL